MKPLLVFLDAGHGGLINDEYVTPGKRSPKFEDGTVLYEGVYNRDIVKRIHDLLSVYSSKEILIVNVSPGNEDIPLWKRVKKANDEWLNLGRPTSIYISIHANAHGNGTTWTTAKGIEVWTSPGQTRSDIFASILLEELETNLDDIKWRYDETDGDKDKEAMFAVLKKTYMPAVLSENGFMTNIEECERMFTDEWRNKIALSHYNAIMKYRKIYM